MVDYVLFNGTAILTPDDGSAIFYWDAKIYTDA